MRARRIARLLAPVASALAALALATHGGSSHAEPAGSPSAAPSVSAAPTGAQPIEPPAPTVDPLGRVKERGIRGFGDVARANLGRDATVQLDLPAAHTILDGSDPTDVDLSLERARLMLYEGDYDGAATLLTRPDLAGLAEGHELLGIALGCARGMAATVRVLDEQHGVLVELQDDEDRALVPLLAETAEKVRTTLAKDLGVELPRPIHVAVVRDQFTLAAMTGLPEKAAQTTGTVAVAKWGRVTMVSPRAAGHGYPWLDTLAHELTHLALTRGTRDRAPLWLQEGVAKREEIRWREPQPLDDFPPADSVAMVGFEKNLARPIDKLGASIALLPSAEEASVAYAEVVSFIRFWTREVGEEALPQLVLRLKSSIDVSRAIDEVSGVGFSEWDKRWRTYLASAPRDVPPDLAPGGMVPGMKEIAKRVRLGELLSGRGHFQVAAMQLGRAHELVPTDAPVRCGLAAALIGSDEKAAAAALVEKIDDVHGRYGRWWSLHGLLHADKDPARSFALGVALDPLDPIVACEEKASPGVPEDAIRAALCEAARRVPQ